MVVALVTLVAGFVPRGSEQFNHSRMSLQEKEKGKRKKEEGKKKREKDDCLGYRVLSSKVRRVRVNTLVRVRLG